MKALALVLAAQLADLAAYLLVGRPDDSVLQALGANVAAGKLAGIALILAIVLLLQRRLPAWSRRGALFATFAGLVGAATGIRAVLG